MLCEGVEADRNGKVYENGIEPDVKIAIPSGSFDESSDPVLKAAQSWLAKPAIL